MNLQETYPVDPFVGHFIDKYQYYDIEEEVILKSIPNGKIESWIINDGSCMLWDKELQQFRSNKESGFHPASNSTAYFKIEGGFKCLNVKWNLSVLALPFFRKFLIDWSDFSLDAFVGKEYFEELRQFDPTAHAWNVTRLDEIFKKAISRHQIDSRISKLVDLIQTHFPYGFKIPDLASQMCVSTKTLERHIKNHLGLFPKELSNILRFSNTTKYHLKQHGSLFLTDSIKFGYYDQSHFIKDCKKVTGYAPTEFFSKLTFSNDLVIESENQTFNT